MKTIKKMYDSAVNLKPLPPTAAKLAEIASVETSDIREAVAIIRFDQVMTANLLKIANSVFSAASRKISDIQEAVVRLGIGRIVELMISFTVRDNYKQPLFSYGYEENDLWRHSVATATAAESMSKYCSTKINSISFTAALLHDIGKLVLAKEMHSKDVDEIMKSVRNGVPWHEAETKVFGFNHADIGAYIVHEWKLPLIIETAIAHHHTIDKQIDPVSDSIRVANYVAKIIGRGIGSEGLSLTLTSDSVTSLKLSREKFEQLCIETALKFEQVLCQFEVL